MGDDEGRRKTITYDAVKDVAENRAGGAAKSKEKSVGQGYHRRFQQ